MLGLRPLQYPDCEGLHSRNRRVRNNHSERTNGKEDATWQRTEEGRCQVRGHSRLPVHPPAVIPLKRSMKTDERTDNDTSTSFYNLSARSSRSPGSCAGLYRITIALLIVRPLQLTVDTISLSFLHANLERGGK